MNVIAYYRVSTVKQEESGLGLDAQRAAVRAFAIASGGAILREYREVESGKVSERPELARALSDCRRSKATLVIAKLDRLSRNVHFLSGLMESGVDFKACDNPHANPLTVHILAAVAEDEVKRISQRTKAALGIYRKEGRVSKRLRDLYPGGVPDEVRAMYGGLLGAHRPGSVPLSVESAAQGRALGSVRNQESAARAYVDLVPLVAELRHAGLSLRAIAGELNARGYTTRRGCPWNPVQVARLLARVP